MVPERVQGEALVRLPHKLVMFVGQAWLPQGAEVTPDHEHDDYAWWPAAIEDWPVEADELIDLVGLAAHRAELVERSFAHILDRGGMRRTWLRGRKNVHKRYLIHVAGHNLGLLMRLLIGAGTPKEAIARGWKRWRIWRRTPCS